MVSVSRVYNPLGLIRIAAVVFLLFFDVGDRIGYFAYVSRVDPDLMTQNFFFRSTGFSFPDNAYGDVFFGKTWTGVFKGAFFTIGLMAGIGLLTRWSLLAFGLLALYFSAGVTSNLTFNHESVLSLHLLFVLAIAPGVKSFSLDALINGCLARLKQRGERFRLSEMSLSIVFGTLRSSSFSQLWVKEAWGVKMVLLLFFLVYMGAGISKELLSDGKWWDGETLGYYLGREEVEDLWIASSLDVSPWEEGKPRAHFVDHTYGFKTSFIGQAIAQSSLLLVLISVVSLVWELVPFMLFMAIRYRNFYLLWSVAMHVGIGLAMKLPFPSYQAYLLLLVDWFAIWNGWKRLGEKKREKVALAS